MKIKHILSIFVLFLLLSACKTQQITTQELPSAPDLSKVQGGMWIPSELKGKNEDEMKMLGSTLTADDIYSTETSSIKDAIVHFGGGCTAEVISDKGLILTNHHCGYDAIQTHSSVEHDYLTDGFWANSFQEELPNPGLTATFIVSMKNVTEQVFQNTQNLSGADLEDAIQTHIAEIKQKTQLEPWQEQEIKPFSNGNEYYLIVKETYKDVRLVGAPPSSIGKFGADTDNWMWPRHSGDFSLFRIYADANNHPAEYAETNRPYVPKHYLPVSVDGVETGDFTMVFGFPGRTDEYLPSVAIDQIINKLNPDKIALREASLAIMDKYMRQNPEIKIQYSSKYAGIANYWKKWIGETQGLQKSGAVAKKKTLEADFQQIVQDKGWTEYQNLLTDFDKNYADFGDKQQQRDYFIEIFLRNVDALTLTFQLYQLEMVNEKQGEAAFQKAKMGFLSDITTFYKDFNAKVDEDLFAKLMYMYDAKYAKTKITEESRAEQWILEAKNLYGKSRLLSLNNLTELLNSEKPLESLNNDVLYAFAKGYITKFYTVLNPQYLESKAKLDATQKVYTKALMQAFPEMRYFPDANSTLRVTYGQVKGYEPRDGVVYEPKTHLEGVMEKYVLGDYEFDVSSRLIDLYNSKDFGMYAENGKLPVDFLGTNHTTGGNSGSPVLDAKGNLIGLNFDRVWEGTMSDYNYDADICRNVMVDIRYVLFVMDKYANAQRLMDELKLVHPKK